ncbi:MAG: 23S rRNA (pseudouridine(1915)-N(3))-methyltransferase RlmH [Proteobacteria bacterium]|nr:23S rRNA (pseudouridine(1915)-N(3))-methyltransferase RlmH [Pseudomonadota bacterium]
MKIRIISVGAIKRSYVKGAVADYLKRTSRYTPTQSIEIKEEAYTKKGSREPGLKREAERILKASADSYIVILADTGKTYTSTGLADFVGSLMNSSRKNVSFIVGGPYGLHSSVTSAADAVLSLSPMTLPHELALLVFSEQLYRAFTILGNEPYSH